jgi:hypothetical protein
MIQPSKEQVESFDYLFAGNNPHVKNFIKWVKDSMAQNHTMMVQPERDMNQMFRLAGSSNALMTILKHIDTTK